MEQLCENLVSLGDRFTDGLTIYIKVVKQASKVVFRITAGCTTFDVIEYALQRLVEVFVLIGAGENIAEQLRGQNKETFFLH